MGVRNTAGPGREVVERVVGLVGFAIVMGQALVVVVVWTNRVDDGRSYWDFGGEFVGGVAVRTFREFVGRRCVLPVGKTGFGWVVLGRFYCCHHGG